jgi:catalase
VKSRGKLIFPTPFRAVKPEGKKEMRKDMVEDKKNYTTTFGIPVGEDQNSLTAGERGPVLIQDMHLLEKIMHFDRERIPERVVHAKGADAHGYFEVTADVTKYTRAKFLSTNGKKTDV